MSILVLFLITSHVYASDLTEVDQVLKPYGFKGPSFFSELSTSNRRAGRKKTFHTILAQSADKKSDFLMELIKPVEKSSYEKFFHSKMTVIYNMYGEQVTPYQGEITNVSTCADEFRPDIVELIFLGEKTNVFVGNASVRNTFGVCTPDLIAKKGVLVGGYIPASKTYIELKIFFKKDIYSMEKVKKILSEFHLLSQRD